MYFHLLLSGGEHQISASFALKLKHAWRILEKEIQTTLKENRSGYKHPTMQGLNWEALVSNFIDPTHNSFENPAFYSVNIDQYKNF